jgi:hypothetical protein
VEWPLKSFIDWPGGQKLEAATGVIMGSNPVKGMDVHFVYVVAV